VSVVETVFELLEASAKQPYIGEPISQLEHALQTAMLAERSGASDALIAAALLHDVGHLCDAAAPAMPGLGVAHHESVGAEWLRALGFPDDVVTLVEDHVRAKRYLVATQPAYRNQLSPASIATLALQGGPMSAAEALAFENERGMRDALKLRAWDEQAKVIGARLPPLTKYGAMLERLLGVR
jgi:2-amino-1-hydroxyethylphosphonate dioxygenase (glycine-forming)